MCLQFSNATAQLLVTAVINNSTVDIQSALTQQFQSISSALRIGLPVTVSSVERYGKCTLCSNCIWCSQTLLDSADGCEAIEDDPLNSNFPTLTLTWPESNIGTIHSFPCPCLDYFGMGASQPTVTRTCEGNFISKARWQPVDYSLCDFTDITFKLCETQLVCTVLHQWEESKLFFMQKCACLDSCVPFTTAIGKGIFEYRLQYRFIDLHT